jgi:hypothetical protein
LQEQAYLKSIDESAYELSTWTVDSTQTRKSVSMIDLDVKLITNCPLTVSMIWRMVVQAAL